MAIKVGAPRKQHATYYYYNFFFTGGAACVFELSFYFIIFQWVSYYIQRWIRNFCLGGQVTTLIYLSRQLHIHMYIRFFIIYTFFYLISYIYIHTHQTKKKKVQYFQSKLCLMAIFHKIKFIFTIFVKFLKNVIFNTNYLILY